MTKNDITSKIVKKLKIQKNDTDDFINTIFEIIADGLAKKDTVLISKFGKFSIKYQKERMGRNPKTGEPIKIAPNYKILFKSSDILKDYVNYKLLKKSK